MNRRLISVFSAVTFLLAMCTPVAWAQRPAGGGAGADRREGLPLKGERKVEFTADEGTWLSLDVSPDGKTIIFELLGDIYAVPIEGGEARALTTGLPFDSQPKFSPDGNWIAFLSDRDGVENLWLMKADGGDPKKLSRLTDNPYLASPAWTPDGEYVIISRTTWPLRTYELWMYHVKGGSGVQVTRARTAPTTPIADRHNAMGVAVSPDGRYLYYARRNGGWGYNLDSLSSWQVARRDRVTGDEDTIATRPGGAFRPALSPDGKWLVYATRHETQTGLRIRELATGEERWLKYPVTRDDQESRYTRDLLPGYTFTPDGRALIVTLDGKLHRLDVASGNSAPIPFTAKVSQEIGPKLYFPQRVEEGPVRARIIQTPSQSPDGKWLAFSAFTELFVMELPGGTPKRISAEGQRAFQPAWSPDGKWLSCVTWTHDGGHIWRVRPDGSGAQQLTRAGAFYSEPAWSPDGQRIVALRSARQSRIEGGFGGSDLIWIPVEGGDATVIVPSRGAGQPHFTSDPNRIYFRTGQGLVSLRWDGTDRRTHIRIVGPGLYNQEEPVPASDIQASPDGKWVLAHVSNQLYLLALPQTGGELPTVNIRQASVPLKQITDVGADYFGWADDGRTLTWAIGSSYFRQPVSTVSFEPPAPPARPEAEKKPEGAESAEAKKPEEPKKPLYEEFEVVVERPRSVPKGTIVLRGARVITMKGDEIIENADVVVTDNRIAGVGKRGAVKFPADARILDVRGTTILPGFIDTHGHWGAIRRGVLDLENWAFLANLAYGVTAGLDVQTSTNDMFAYQDLVDAGVIIGHRAYSTGPGIFSNNAFNSLDETKNVVAKYKRHYRTRHLKSYLIGNRKQRQWMVQASKELEMMPTTEGGIDLKLDLTHILDGMKGNEHNFPIAPLYGDVAQLAAQSGIFYTPTLIVSFGGPWGENFFYTNTEVHDDAKLRRFVPHNVIDSNTRRRQWFRSDEYFHPKVAEAAGRIVRAGGRVGVGSHGQLQGLGYHWEMWMLASGGWKPMEVLRAATLHGAEALALAQDLGSIEPGKLADMVILSKNPLDDIRNTNSVRYVMKNGELFEGDTLNQLWPVEKKLPPLWWWDEKP
jgi:Tol biopolymer transport system component